MDLILLALCCLFLLVLATYLLTQRVAPKAPTESALAAQQAQREETQNENNEAPAQAAAGAAAPGARRGVPRPAVRIAGGVRQRTALGRMNRRREEGGHGGMEEEEPGAYEEHHHPAGGAAAAGDDNGNDEDSGSDGGGDEDHGDVMAGAGASGFRVKKLGKKKTEKLERKEEKRKLREYEQAQREEKKKQAEEAEEEWRRQRAEEREKGLAEDLKEKARLEAVARQEQEEYDRLKGQFVVEEAGVYELPPEQVEALLARMEEYIKTVKVVTVEELASEFQIRTQDAVTRLRQLDQESRIQGVMDERGKYVYITREEFEAVAAFMKRKGRVSKEELAAISNKLIRLTAMQHGGE